jgi:hypothetical protein
MHVKVFFQPRKVTTKQAAAMQAPFKCHAILWIFLLFIFDCFVILLCWLVSSVVFTHFVGDSPLRP